jgi:hypothetical protein
MLNCAGMVGMAISTTTIDVNVAGSVAILVVGRADRLVERI